MLKRPLVTVGGLIIASDGDLLLVRSKKWHDLYSLPGGKVEEGESREAAFSREIWEETGLKITNIRFAFVQECIFSPEFWEKKHFVMNDFIADLDVTYTKENVRLNDEAYTYCWISPLEALKLPLQHECRLLIEWYIAYLKRETKKSLGVLGIHQHRISCVVGIYPEERQQEQVLIIDAKIKLDLSKCLDSGRMEDTVDYVLLAQICTEWAQQNQYLLLETMAADILSEYIRRFDAEWAWIRIQKPSAIPTATAAYVEFERYKEEVT